MSFSALGPWESQGHSWACCSHSAPLGGVAGGFLAGRISARLGNATILVGLVATVISIAPLLVANPGWQAQAAIVNFELASAFGGTVVVAAAFGRIQRLALPATIARTMAVATNTLQAAGLAGTAVGGTVASIASPRAALGVGVGLLVVVSVWMAVALLIEQSRPHATQTSPVP